MCVLIGINGMVVKCYRFWIYVIYTNNIKELILNLIIDKIKLLCYMKYIHRYMISI